MTHNRPHLSLASQGGTPVRQQPLPAWPAFDEEMVEAAAAVLRGGKVNYWTGGDVKAFEKEFAARCGVSHGVAVANGTVALELALRAVGVGPGDEVVVTSRTFVASASAIIACGAQPVFADIDRESQNVTAETVRPVLSPRTKAIIAVHLAGWPCDMQPLMELAEQRGAFVIEDAAQAHGAAYQGRPVGSLGHVAAFSFCQDKILTTAGEGGMVLTDRREWFERAWSLKDHGKSWDAVHNRQHPPGFRWLHEGWGTNLRMTEMQGAVGRVALRRLEGWVERRREYAALLNQACQPFPALRRTLPPAGIDHSYYKHYVFVRPEKLAPGWSRDRIMQAICAEGVPCYSGSCSEIYLEKAFTVDQRPPARLPVAQELGETSLMFLVHPTLTTADVQDVCAAVRKVMRVASDADSQDSIRRAA